MNSQKFLHKEVSVAIKGIAALGIMLGHYVTADMSWILHRIFSGELWVGIFFFFSGYGLYKSKLCKKNYLDGFVKNKIVSIYLPFFLAESFFTLCVLLVEKQFSIYSFIVGSLGLHLYNGVLWYVIELILINAIFLILCKIAPLTLK